MSPTEFSELVERESSNVACELLNNGQIDDAQYVLANGGRLAARLRRLSQQATKNPLSLESGRGRDLCDALIIREGESTGKLPQAAEETEDEP